MSGWTRRWHSRKANRINEIAVPTSAAWLGIIAAGKTWYDLRGALHDIGLDDEASGTGRASACLSWA